MTPTNRKVTPGDVRERLGSIRALSRELEEDLEKPISRANIITLIPVRHELVEASDALDRAIEMLDEIMLGIN